MIGKRVTNILVATILTGTWIGEGARGAEHVQPIMLTAATTCCQSPASTAVPVTVPRHMCALPSRLEPSPLVSVGSTMVPLPSGPQWRGYGSEVTTVYSSPLSTTPLPSCPPVTVCRPIMEPTIPAGYVMGRTLLGQPTLYKPGQPVRNFLRYITW